MFRNIWARLLLALAVSAFFGSVPAAAKPMQLAISASDFTRLQELDQACRLGLRGQNPSIVKSVGLSIVRGAPTAALSGYAGAAAAGFAPSGSPVTARDYGVNAGISGVFSGITQGFTSHSYGRRGTLGSCMMGMVNRGARAPGRAAFRDLIIAYNAYAVNGRAPRGPDGQARLGKGEYFVIPYPREQSEIVQDNEDAGGDSQVEDADQQQPPPQP
jgi:hypothetical protein